jgi:hypothetical protein
MQRELILILVLAAAATAQQPVAPTPETVGVPRGEDSGTYNITQSFELGYRWSAVGGNLGMYRSIANYGNGIRLLGGSFTMDSKDGHGRYFDKLALQTQGLGNDPYQSATLRLEKNGLYQYDMHWRSNDYFNPGLTTAAGLHQFDTTYRVQDHDLVLLPQSKIRFRLGFSRSNQDGPALSTVQELDVSGTALPVFADLRQQWTEYRLGADVNWKGFRLVVTRRWDGFKDDSPFSANGVVAAGNGTGAGAGQISLNQFQRFAPIHGASPGWFGDLFTRRKWFGIDARMTYISGTSNFSENEFGAGVNQFGLAESRQIAVGGVAQRPMLAGSFTLTLFPVEGLSVINTTAVTSNRVDGSSIYSEINTGTDLGATVYFRYLAIRLITNSTIANYRVNRWLGFFGGYLYTDRSVQTIEAFNVPASPGTGANDAYEVGNRLSTGRIGVRLNPIKPLSFSLEGELGRADNPLTPISQKNYHTINGRVNYRLRTVQLSGVYSQAYNLNPEATLASFSSHSRTYTASASWSPRAWFGLDASYTKLHLDTVSGLAFFASQTNRPQLQTGYSSLYLSNLHAANLIARFGIRRRIDVFAGVSLTKDTGDGRAAAASPGTADPIQSLLSSVQTFPLTYVSPMGRVSIKITPKLRWNAGWQFYNYAERFQLLGFYQNFHANTGYTSVLWSF